MHPCERFMWNHRWLGQGIQRGQIRSTVLWLGWWAHVPASAFLRTWNWGSDKMWQDRFQMVSKVGVFQTSGLFQVEFDVFCRDCSSSVHPHRFKIAVCQRGWITCLVCHEKVAFIHRWWMLMASIWRGHFSHMEPYGCSGFLLAWTASTEQTKEPSIFDHFGFSSLFSLTRTLLPNVLICKAALQEAQWREDAVMHELLREQQDPSTWTEENYRIENYKEF